MIMQVEKKKIFVVDDTSVIRMLLTKIINSAPDMEVVSTASNGRFALEKLKSIKPDLIILDQEMPEMDGMETLTHVLQVFPKMPVIMFSALSEKGGKFTLDALAKGAADYLSKPANMGSPEQATEYVSQQLLPKIRSLLKMVKTEEKKHFAPLTPSPFKSNSNRKLISKIKIIAIGVSTGGPNALAELMPRFPKNLSVPIVIVQHMPPIFTRLLAERLTTKCQIPIYEGIPGMLLEPGKAYLAPGDYHMVLEQNGNKVQIGTQQEAPENSCRPAVDVLFRSVAKIYGSSTLGVILTGMGQDGLIGSQLIKAQGGYILAQDEASSVVWGMPGAVSKHGVAEEILPLNQIGERVMQILLK